jgi:hypothetical protein
MGLGKTLAPSRKPKKRPKPTEAQLAACRANLSHNKENTAPVPSPPLPPPKAVAPPRDWKRECQNLQRKARHSNTRQKKLETELAVFKVSERSTKHVVEVSAQRVKELTTIVDKLVAEGRKKLAASSETTGALRKQVKALKQRVRRSVRSLSRAVDRAKKKWSMVRMTKRGAYTAQARSLARLVADSGCARGKVGPLIKWIGQIFGIRVDRCMDRRTVGRAIEEGGVAARMQAIYELAQNQGAKQHLIKP